MLGIRPSRLVSILAVSLAGGCSDRSEGLPGDQAVASFPEGARVAPALEPPVEPPDWVGPGHVLADAAADARPPEWRQAWDEEIGDGWDDSETLQARLRPCEEAGCELVIEFNMPVIAIGTVAEADLPEARLDPEQEGDWSWRSETELAFVPEAGSLNWGQEVTVNLGRVVPVAGESQALAGWAEHFMVPYFSAGGKVATWEVIPGRPRFVAFLGKQVDQIGEDPIKLLYDQKVNAKQVADRIRIENAAGEELEARVWRPKEVVGFDGDVDHRYVVAVRVVGLPEHGETVKVIPPRLPSEADAGPGEQRIFTVNTKFELENFYFQGETYGERLDPEQPIPLLATLILDFNNAFDLAELESALEVTPAPASMTVSGNWTHAHVTMRLSPGTRYRLRSGRGIEDVLGNSLRDPPRVSFRAQDLPPLLEGPAQPVLVEQGRARVPVRGRNIEHLRAEVRRLESAAAWARAIGGGEHQSCDELETIGKARRLKPDRRRTEMNELVIIDVPLHDKPGLFCIELVADGRGSEARGELSATALVQSSDLGVTAKLSSGEVFAWVTRLGDPAPVAGARVVLLDSSGGRVGLATTDASGSATVTSKGRTTQVGPVEPLFLVARHEQETTVVRLIDERLSAPWQFGLEGATQRGRSFDAALFTERGVYRPGETTHVKLIAGASFAGSKAQAVVQDPRGQLVLERALRLDGFGTAHFDVHLQEEAAVGEYLVRVSHGDATATRSFRVEEYRVPTFQVTVTGEDWQLGRDAQAVIGASYLHGGTLDGRELRWEVRREPHVFAPSGFSGFTFQVQQSRFLSGTVASGNVRLDGQGKRVISFEPSHPVAAGPMRYTVEATVTDVDRQAYAGRLSQVVHPAAFYVGVRQPSQRLVAAGERLSIPIVAVAPDGKTIPGVKVRAQLERVDYHVTPQLVAAGNVQLHNRPIEVKRGACLVTTGESAVACQLTLPEAGAWQVRAWAQDREQRVAQAGFELRATGDNRVAWPRFDRDRIAVVADKARYRPGDVARLVVETPYETARGLLTLERDGVVDRRVFEIDADTPAIEVPIKAAHAPNIFASVVLVRGRIHDEADATGFETGAPGFKIGYVELDVDPETKRLAVAVEPARVVTTPGDPLEVTIDVRDNSGEPRSAQATVAVVDEAVLGLTGFRTPDPLAQIYAARPLGVLTAESRLELPHAKRARRERIFPGGDGGDASGNIPDFSNVLRKLFESTAYWNPTVEVGEDGKARIVVEMPDNTTRYRIMAVVVDRDTRVGSAEARIEVTRPLIVQPVLPRFVYPGDELRLEALVFNGTAAKGEVAVASELVGMKRLRGKQKQTMQVQAGGSASYAVRARVTGRQEATVRFTAQLGEHQDAVEVKLPILSPGTKRTLVASRTVSGTETVDLELPADRLPGTTRVEVVTSTTALTQLKEAVQYLMRYPNGCIEQTTSTAYPLVVLDDLLPEIGVEVDEAELRKLSEAGIRRILSFQTEAGGLSYWPGGAEPHAFATAFGLTALLEGKARGYDVPDEALRRMAGFLEAHLRKGNVTEQIAHGNMSDGDTRAFFVMTLGRLGRPQPGYISKLWEDRAALSAFGLSFLALAASELDRDHPLVRPLLAEVRRASTEEIEQAWFDGERKGGYSFDSPLRTHASALLAFATGDAASDMGGKLLTGLLARQRGGMWGNTQENVFGIMGVAAMVGSSPGGAPSMRLSVAGREIETEAMEKVSRRVRRLRLDEATLALQAGAAQRRSVTLTNEGGPPIILTARAEFEVELSDENRAARSNGFAISRTYEALDGASLEGEPMPLGSLVRVRLRVDAAAKQNYVAIDDELPAGLEPLNANLDTAERVSLGEVTPIVQRSLGLLSYSETRDERVAFYVDDMPSGSYEYSYVARATTPGTFLRPAAGVEAMYAPEIAGSTAVDSVTVK